MGVIKATKTLDIVLLAHSRIVHPDSLFGVVIDVEDAYALRIFLYQGYVEDTADTNPGSFVISGTPKGSDDDLWVPLMDYPVLGRDPDKVNLNASLAAGVTALTVDAVTGLASKDLIYLQDTNGGSPTVATGALAGAEALSEWAFLRKAATTTATVAKGIKNAKDANDDLYNDAFMHAFTLNTSDLARVRVDFIHEGATGANVDVMAKGVLYLEDETTPS